MENKRYRGVTPESSNFYRNALIKNPRLAREQTTSFLHGVARGIGDKLEERKTKRKLMKVMQLLFEAPLKKRRRIL